MSCRLSFLRDLGGYLVRSVDNKVWSGLGRKVYKTAHNKAYREAYRPAYDKAGLAAYHLAHEEWFWKAYDDAVKGIYNRPVGLFSTPLHKRSKADYRESSWKGRVSTSREAPCGLARLDKDKLHGHADGMSLGSRVGRLDGKNQGVADGIFFGKKHGKRDGLIRRKQGF